ncbi:HWE histidine kinase domain-containing protein [Rhizobium sp. OAE497]|uniref:sensor histidine kinase n=1 Tax=Rhizobium sp. OAE497 TaxID=2663796 RepID=UPI0018F33355
MSDLFQELAENAPVMIWRSATDAQCDYFNKPWLAFTGRFMEQELGMGWLEGVHTEDIDRCLDTYSTAFEKRIPFVMEYRLRRHDGAFRWILDNGKPFERDGAFAGYFGSCVDIHDQKDLQAGRQLMIAELNHRVRNNIAVMQAMLNHTARRATTKAELQDLLSKRVRGLGLIHGLLSETGWQQISLLRLLDRIIEASNLPSRFAVTGTDVAIEAGDAEAIATALQELVFNAQEHGALSNEGGQVWIDLMTQSRHVLLVWRETGGPRVEHSGRVGFGSRLVSAYVRANQPFEFLPQGLRCSLHLPIAT